MIEALYFIIEALRWIIIVDAISSWFRSAEQFPRNITGQITEPLYAPIRALIGGKSGMDFSPLIMLLLLHLARAMLSNAG